MKMFNSTSIRIIATFLSIVMLFSSCRLYHIKSRSILHNNAERLLSKKVYPQFILHCGNNYWQIKNPVIKDSMVSGVLVSVDEKVDYIYRKALTKRNFRVSSIDEYQANQLHIYVEAFEFDGKFAKVNMNEIKELKILDKNKGLSTLINVGIASASAIGSLTVFLIIACGCPHNYTFDGDKYQYNNSLFTGATAPNLERHDYKTLPDYRPEKTNYSMLVKNEENESQFTNLMELIVVNHPENVSIVLDKQGNIYTLLKRESPLNIIDDLGNDLSSFTNYVDDNPYTFDQLSEDYFSHIYSTFKVNNTKNAKIIIRSKNSSWGGLVYHSFAELMGKNYKKWVKHNLKRTQKEVQEDLAEAGIPLMVEVKKSGEWVYLETIDLIGEVNYNEVAISVPSHFLSDTTVTFRITSGYKFWELDAVQMDFSEPQKIHVQNLKPKSAFGNQDFTNAISFDDVDYMKHLNTGDTTLIIFENLPKSEESRSLFLHSKGYYQSKNQYFGPTNWQAIVAMKQKGGFSLFSKELFEVYKNISLLQ